MQSVYDKVSTAALALSLRERVQLAQELAGSLDSEPPEETASLWEAEITRRLRQVHAGEVTLIDAQVAFQQARRSLGG